MFSYRAYRVVSLLAQLPLSKRFRLLKRLRRNANKVLTYMMQTHMLHEMFVAHPPWMVGNKHQGASNE
jgi:hypothetical protein